MDTILFIGAGNMGGAILKGLVSANAEAKEALAIYELNDSTAEALVAETGVRRFTSLPEAGEWASIIVIGVKPQIFSSVSKELKQFSDSKLFISIMAGVPVKRMSEEIGFANDFVRTMPNIPLTVGKGAIALATDNLSEETIKKVEVLFSSVGDVARVTEAQIDGVTGLSGSGPAYVFQFIDAFINAGVKVGLTRDASKKLVMATLEGSVEFLKQNDMSAADATGLVTSPGGTTIYGVHSLEKDGFRVAIMNAVEAAVNRSKELGA
ncbi:MAG: pyrroline-5-carboxylate reductase [Fibrobacterales bacterium]